MIKRLIYEQNMRPHHKFPGNANTSSLPARQALHITMTANQLVRIVTQRHSMYRILHNTLFLTEEAWQLK